MEATNWSFQAEEPFLIAKKEKIRHGGHFLFHVIKRASLFVIVLKSHRLAD
jgi:hypothetical protein